MYFQPCVLPKVKYRHFQLCLINDTGTSAPERVTILTLCFYYAPVLMHGLRCICTKARCSFKAPTAVSGFETGTSRRPPPPHTGCSTTRMRLSPGLRPPSSCPRPTSRSRCCWVASTSHARGGAGQQARGKRWDGARGRRTGGQGADEQGQSSRISVKMLLHCAVSVPDVGNGPRRECTDSRSEQASCYPGLRLDPWPLT